MNEAPHVWHRWAQTIHRWGGGNWVATLLEAVGPLTFLGGQAVYFGQPLLKQIFPSTDLNALAEMLDDPQRAKAFIAYLRQYDEVPCD